MRHSLTPPRCDTAPNQPPAILQLDASDPDGYYGARVAPVAQLDRVLPSEGRGRGFESRRVHQMWNGRASGREIWGFFVFWSWWVVREGVELCRDCRGGVGRELSGVLVWAVGDFRAF